MDVDVDANSYAHASMAWHVARARAAWDTEPSRHVSGACGTPRGGASPGSRPAPAPSWSPRHRAPNATTNNNNNNNHDNINTNTNHVSVVQ